jgi:glycosyltransferase involved in cell wall biosynthesis
MQISVVIPLYNKCKTIRRALGSVFAQSVQPYEIIVVNDGSTDESERIVEQINDPFIRLVHQTNAGVSAARNKGIELAKGDWIAFLDADDEWKPEFLETMQFLARTYLQCRVVACAYLLQDHHGNQKPIVLHKMPFMGEHGVLANYFEVASCSHPPVWTSAVVAGKEALISIGGFPVGIISGEDLLTWARLAVRYAIGYTLLPLSIFNIDEVHQITQKPTRLHDVNDPVGKGLVLLKDVSNQKYLKNYISHWFKMRASVNIRLNNRKLVIKYALKALGYNPFNFKAYLFIIMAFLPVYIQDKIKQIYLL